MCTVSWSLEKGGYRLFFNRDEQLSRVPAEGPMKWVGEGGTFYGPRDPVGGGTWIGVNPHGWTTAVLNFYEAADFELKKRPSSRGELVSRFAALSDNRMIEKTLSTLSLEAYAPFHFLRVSPLGEGRVWTSDGESLAAEGIDDHSLPLTTSSVDTARVIARRKAIYASLNAGGTSSAEALTMFHRHFDSSDPAASVSMRRDDAQTVSLSEVFVQPKGIAFDYFERAIDGIGFRAPVSLNFQRIK